MKRLALAALFLAAPAAAQSVDGTVGLVRMGTADVGPPGQVRLGLAAEFFTAERFLLATPDGGADRHRRLAGALSLGVTPLPYLEVHAALGAAANHNQRFCGDSPAGPTCQSEPGRSDGETIRTFGDLALGAKLVRSMGRLAAGALVGVQLPSSVSGLSFAPSATSLALDGLVGWELPALPVRTHLSLGYLFDRSRARRDLSYLATPEQVVAAFAYGMGGMRARAALGLEARFLSAVALRPMAEYHLEVITDVANPDLGGGANRDQHAVTFGLALATRGGFAVTAGADVALRSPGRQFGPRLPPYNLVVMVSQQLDTSAPRVVTRTVTVERPAPPPPPEGRLVGHVTDDAGAPVEGAVISVAGMMRGRTASDPDGGYRTAALAPGPRTLEVAAPGYRPARVEALVAEGEIEAPIVLQRLGATMSARLLDPAGAPVAARVFVDGERRAPDETGDTKLFLAPGPHLVRVDADGFLSKARRLEVEDGRDGELALTLRPRPPVPSVSVAAASLVLTRPLPLGAEAEPVLDEVVDMLLARLGSSRLRIEVRRRDGAAMAETQARSIARYLVEQGVAESRLMPVGLTAPRPAVELLLVE